MSSFNDTGESTPGQQESLAEKLIKQVKKDINGRKERTPSIKELWRASTNEQAEIGGRAYRENRIKYGNDFKKRKTYKPLNIDPETLQKEYPGLYKRAEFRYYSGNLDTDIRPIAFFETNEIAARYLEQQKERYIKDKMSDGKSADPNRPLTVVESVEVFIESGIGATVTNYMTGEYSEGRESGSGTLVVYNYDTGLYTQDEDHINLWVQVLMGKVDSTSVKAFILSLQAASGLLHPYRPLPKWIIPVGNGLYNTVTKKLCPHTPYWVVTNKIQTDYNPNVKEPVFASGMTFEHMVVDLANNVSARRSLILQMCKSIILGHSPDLALFVLIGSGGDGKSTFMELIKNVIGSDNTGILTFDDLDAESKVLKAVEKRLILGPDNNDDVFVKNTGLLKSLISREPVSLNRKFLSAVHVTFNGTIVQVCNKLPTITSSSSGAMQRRLMAILCERSHYERKSEIGDMTQIINNKQFKEYVLAFLLNEKKVPYFSNFNSVDRDVINVSLEGNDVVSQFFEELYAQGYFANGITYISQNLLYGIFQDWFSSNASGKFPVSSSKFLELIRPSLRKRAGFIDSRETSVKLSHAGEAYGEENDPTVWCGDYRRHENTARVLENNVPSKFFVKLDEFVGAAPPRAGERDSHSVGVLNYFNFGNRVVLKIINEPDRFYDDFVACGLEWLLVEEDSYVRRDANWADAQIVEQLMGQDGGVDGQDDGVDGQDDGVDGRDDGFDDWERRSLELKNPVIPDWDSLSEQAIRDLGRESSSKMEFHVGGVPVVFSSLEDVKLFLRGVSVDGGRVSPDDMLSVDNAVKFLLRTDGFRSDERLSGLSSDSYLVRILYLKSILGVG